MKLFNLRKTCESNPAQWEATNEVGENVYIRYRFDRLTVHCPFNPNNERNYQAFMDAQILDMSQVHDDEYRGVMATSEMLALTGFEEIYRKEE